MKRKWIIGIGIVVAIMFVGYIACIVCINKLAKVAGRNPNYDMSMGAVAEISKLMQDGAFPGIVKGEDFTLRDSGFSLSEKTITYPAQRAFEVHKAKDDEYVYKYILSKSAPDQPWNLKQAWMENKSGKIVDLGVVNGPAKQ